MLSGETNPTLNLPPDHLARHPECGSWLTAILFYHRAKHWPQGAYELALSTVDSLLQIHSTHFLVSPYIGWPEAKCQRRPDDQMPEATIDASIPPTEAMELLNAILGDALVFTNGMRTKSRFQGHLEQIAGVPATWRSAGIWDNLGDSLQVPLDANVRAAFIFLVPLDGQLPDRARSWAQSFVRAKSVRDLVARSLANADKIMANE